MRFGVGLGVDVRAAVYSFVALVNNPGRRHKASVTEGVPSVSLTYASRLSCVPAPPLRGASNDS